MKELTEECRIFELERRKKKKEAEELKKREDQAKYEDD
jgi:hypothetical protein